VLIENISCGTGDGYSKKESDQNAAKQALKRIKHDKELLAGIQNAGRRGKVKSEE
jgi:ribonuclease-3